MGNIVKRASNPPPDGDEVTTRHVGEHLVILSHLRLGAHPSIRLEWTIDPTVLGKAKLLGFRSTSGFSPEDDPDDLTCHGQMFVETTTNGEHPEHLPEATYYYTFLLRQPGFLGLVETRSTPVRFQENIASASVAIKRLEDQLKLHDLIKALSLQAMKHEITELEARARLTAAREKATQAHRQLNARDAAYQKFREGPDKVLLAILHDAKYRKDLDADPEFQSLSPADRKQFLRIYKRIFKPAEQTFEP